MQNAFSARGGAFGWGTTRAFVVGAALSIAASAFAQDAVNRASDSGTPASASGTPATTNPRVSGVSSTTSATEPAPTEEMLVIQGDELPSAYGAPGAFSRSRFSPTTTAYVLPPGSVYAALIYQGDIFREGQPDHVLAQEVEVGLPYRFGIAAENRIERFIGNTENSSFSVEARYALADWNKIPLNPTLFAEYKFGTGKILHEEGPPPPPEEAAEEGGGRPDLPDAYEFRLLLSQDFGEHVEWAFNAFFERENTGDRGREWGFAQSIQMPVLLPHERLKAGVEMQYQNFTVKDTRGSPIHRFGIGPSLSFKPSARCRFDFTPLFGVNDDTPAVRFFAVFSYVFGGGGGEENGAEAPTSTRTR